METFPFCEIKDFHAEVLRSIERGQTSWSDSFSEEQARTLVSTVKAKLSISIDIPTESPICVLIKLEVVHWQETILDLTAIRNFYMCVESVCGRVRTQPILEFDILQRIADLDKKLIRPLLMQVCIVFIVRYWKVCRILPPLLLQVRIQDIVRSSFLQPMLECVLKINQVPLLLQVRYAI